MSGPVDFAEVCALLRDHAQEVAERYAPGGYVDGGRYWALNPWRGDRRIGSFYVDVSGPRAGRYVDHATGEHGDMLDLIQAAIGGDRRAAFREACALLGLAEESEAQRAQRKRMAAAAAEERARRKAEAEKDVARKRSAAQARGIRCEARLDGTPVAGYLAARGVGLHRLGRTPHAIRYHPGLEYRHVDQETGEIVEGRFPAMVTAVTGPHVEGAPAAFWGAHRTYLALDPRTGLWGKAPVPAPKKVLGSVMGGYVRLWAGYGPRGGKAVPLGRARPGARVIVTEGIEDGLSAAVMMPGERVAVAISLGNCAAMELPAAVTQVVLVRDNDESRGAIKLAEKAIKRWQDEGRTVTSWKNTWGGNDLNDALRAAMAAEEGAEGAA